MAKVVGLYDEPFKNCNAQLLKMIQKTNAECLAKQLE